jgi:methionyl-tRNA synthetase
MSGTYSLTTTLPYVNADPHIGFAMEIVQADMLCRAALMRGLEVAFNTGTDEHGQKIWQKATEAGVSPKDYCDAYAAKFHDLKSLLNLSYTNFIRTTDAHHIVAAQEFWRRCATSGDIYKKAYEVKYCVGCELEKTDSELVDGKCPIHPSYAIELIQEENYFFRFSRYQQPLLDFYAKHPVFVVPEGRYNEVKSFVAGGLQDFSISRLATKMPWGIPVPGDETQVMYVWFDALINYISTHGWPDHQTRWAEFWPGIQVAGKDNLRQQAAMWQAMLLSAEVPNSQQVFIHGFITADGQKMSKSVGNVVDPRELVATYGVDPVRHFLLGGLPSWNDGDYTQALFEEWYSSRLANGVGNLSARVLTMVEKYCEAKVPARADDRYGMPALWDRYHEALRQFRFDDAIRVTDELVTLMDGAVDTEKPWAMAKEGKDVGPLLYQLMEGLRHLALMLWPSMPATAEKIIASLGVENGHWNHAEEQAGWGKLEPGTTIARGEALFPRLEKK